MIEHATIDEALVAAQAEFPTIAKSRKATVEGKDGKRGYTYSYADLSDILAQVRPILSAHGLAQVQRMAIVDGKQALVTELRHRSGGVIAGETILPIGNVDPQKAGIVITYYRRYALTALLGLAAEEDTDARGVSTRPRAAEAQERQTRQPPADERPRGLSARDAPRPAPADHHGDDRGEPTYRLGVRNLRWPEWIVAALDDARAMDADDLRLWWHSDALKAIRQSMYRRHPEGKAKFAALRAEIESLLAPLPAGGDPEKARAMVRGLGA